MSTPYNLFAENLIILKRFHTYGELQEKYGVNQYYLWRIINEHDYTPPVKVRRKLKVVMEESPPRIAIRKDDPASAARSIVRNFETEMVDRLIVEIERMRDEQDVIR